MSWHVVYNNMSWYVVYNNMSWYVVYSLCHGMWYIIICHGMLCHGMWYMMYDRVIFGIVCGMVCVMLYGMVYGLVWYSMILWIVDSSIYTMLLLLYYILDPCETLARILDRFKMDFSHLFGRVHYSIL